MLTVAYIANRFPRWGGGWVLNEVTGLIGAGIDLKLFSFRLPHDDVARQKGMRAWIEATSYVPGGTSGACIRAALWWLFRSPLAVLRGLRMCRSLGGRMSRATHILEVFWLASRIRRSGAGHIHAQHADYVADAAMIVAAILDLPFSLSGHARDLYTHPGRLDLKIRSARFISTCTRFNEDRLKSLSDQPDKVVRIHHGVDLDRFTPSPDRPEEAGRLITVTRLKEKKGIPWLISALGILRDRGVDWRLDIYGEGDRREEIRRQISGLSLDGRVRLMGTIEHEKLPGVLHGASLFILPCIILENKDRDGIPNTILEALAAGVPVVSTKVSGIPEVIHEEAGGITVPQRDAGALADAIERMMNDADLRRRCAVGGRKLVERDFGIRAGGEALAAMFRKAASGSRPSG